MNTVKIEITSCNQCCYAETDINGTYKYCHKRNKFLYWFGDYNEDDFPIPDWCPLLEDKVND